MIVKFEVSEQVFGLFPNPVLGVVIGSIEEALPALDQRATEMRQKALDDLLASEIEVANIVSHVNVSTWRSAYQAFGVKAKTYKPTHESYIRRLLKDEELPRSINPIVDIYLANQVRHVLPHGGYDASTLAGTVKLDVASAGEEFHPLRGGTESVNSGEIIYRDDVRVLTRRWNYEDNDATKITDETSQFVLVIESPSSEIPV
ncbi:MAG: phenylalanine--tRNA ligase beta subunit-related protein, partial [Planctomycetota bacterium]